MSLESRLDAWVSGNDSPSPLLRVRDFTSGSDADDADQVRAALESLCLESPSRFHPTYLVTGQDSNGLFFARAPSKEAGENLVESQWPSRTKYRVLLESLTDGKKVPAHANEGDTPSEQATALLTPALQRHASRGESGKMPVGSIGAGRSGLTPAHTRQPSRALLRSNTELADRVYRTFSRMELESSDDLSPVKAAPDPLQKPEPSFAPAASLALTSAAPTPAPSPKVALSDASATALPSNDVPPPTSPSVASATTPVVVAPKKPSSSSGGLTSWLATGSTGTTKRVDRPPNDAPPDRQTTPPQPSAEPESPSISKKPAPKRAAAGRPKMTEEEKAEARRKREQLKREAKKEAQEKERAAAAFGKKSTTVRMGSGADLIDDGDSSSSCAGDQGEEDAGGPQVAASFDQAAYDRMRYEEEEARVAAMMEANGRDDELQIEATLSAKPIAITPPSVPARAGTPARGTTAAEGQAATSPAPKGTALKPASMAYQCTLQNFAEAAAATKEFKQSYERQRRESMTMENDEYVMKDVVVYVHKESKEEIDEDTYQRLLGHISAAAGAAGTAAPGVVSRSTSASRRGASVGSGGASRQPTTSDHVVIQRGGGSDRAAQPAPTAKRATTTKASTAGKRKSAPSGTKSIASFFGGAKQ